MTDTKKEGLSWVVELLLGILLVVLLLVLFGGSGKKLTSEVQEYNAHKDETMEDEAYIEAALPKKATKDFIVHANTDNGGGGRETTIKKGTLYYIMHVVYMGDNNCIDKESMRRNIHQSSNSRIYTDREEKDKTIVCVGISKNGEVIAMGWTSVEDLPL